MSQPAAITAAARSAESPVERLHAEIVGHEQAVEADPAADDRLDHDRRLAGRPLGVPGGVDDMGGHPHRRVAKADERLEVDLQRLLAGLDDRQLDMAVAHRPAMARHMLDHADHAALAQPVEHRAAERGDLHRLGAERAVADNVGGAGLADVEQGQAIDVDPRPRGARRRSPGHWPATASIALIGAVR